MQKTNLVPAIEERTVSGSSVSFNSAFALPLKACKVSFSATQAGSGDPSPSNPRAISGVSAIGLTANSTPVSVSLGDTRYGGELDVLTGVLTITHRYDVYDSNNHGYWTKGTDRGDMSRFNLQGGQADIKRGSNCLCNYLTYGGFISGVPTISVHGSDGISVVWFPANLLRESSLTAWYEYLDNHALECVFEFRPEKYITIQLTPTQLSSIIGNNTFSTDTGTLEITFSDLQEKSASGAVATFNTALAMPLASCNIAVNAWQEGSGEPSPSNVKPIHGFSEVNVTANNVVYTIQLGQEVYGGSYNSVSGVLTITRKAYKIKDVSFTRYNFSGIWTFLPHNITSKAVGVINIKCESYKTSSAASVSGMPDLSIKGNPTANTIYIRDDRFSSVDAFKEAMGEYIFEYELRDPIEIQLEPTPINTFNGSNTIFADTGDVDLTYKDLDIAKRGNFREVFKLPS